MKSMKKSISFQELDLFLNSVELIEYLNYVACELTAGVSYLGIIVFHTIIKKSFYYSFYFYFLDKTKPRCPWG